MNAALCPDRARLGSYLLGKLAGEAAEVIEQHLATCESCLNAARELPLKDEFTLAMRGGKPAWLGKPGEVAALIERVKTLRAALDTSETQETFAPERRSPLKYLSEEDLSFLAPPRRPDEIGRLGKYRVLDVLGVGGMGIIFKAEDSTRERLVALKVMRPDLADSQSAKRRFLREAKATAAISHDHIVTIHEVGEHGHIPFIAMQFLRGESLQTRLQRERQLDQREVLRIGRQVAAGLEAAHRFGLIHRDVKPDNIWLEEGAGGVKILDFGLVRTDDYDADLTQAGLVVGTPRYMAPEQVRGEKLDPRCDLFSLGSVLYRMAAGKAPFGGSNPELTLRAVSQLNPQPLETLRPDLAPELARLIMQLLSKDRNQRPGSAREVSQSLSAIENPLDERSGERSSPAAAQPQLPPPRFSWKIRLAMCGMAVFAVALACLLSRCR
jgi:serine/threonine protein kinase